MYGGRQGYEDNYYKDDNNRYGYHYDNKHPKSSHVTIQKIKFVNSNINVSGIHTTEIPQQPSGLAVAETENETDGPDAANGSRSGDMIDFDKNLVNISISKYQSERTGESQC